MHRNNNRRTATKVKDGRVQRKNRSIPSTHHRLELARCTPQRGFRHVVSKQDVLSFIALIPEWERLSERLERIVLAGGNDDCDGYYRFFHREETGGIYLHAWPQDLWVNLHPRYFVDHIEILERLRVSFDHEKNAVHCRFTEAQARAFMLLHVFMHELGHHRDALRQKHRSTRRSEDCAEHFANGCFHQLFPAYVRAFGDPAAASG